MKANIHPTYHEKAVVACSCGNSFETGSTSASLSVEVCSACHPFYTGKQKVIDIAGRVDKFKKRQEETAILQKQHKPKKKPSPTTPVQEDVIRISK